MLLNSNLNNSLSNLQFGNTKIKYGTRIISALPNVDTKFIYDDDVSEYESYIVISSQHSTWDNKLIFVFDTKVWNATSEAKTVVINYLIIGTLKQ